MSFSYWFCDHGVMTSLRCIAALLLLASLAGSASAADEQGFVDRYDVKPADFVTTGRNDYFVLEPDYQLVYQAAGKNKKDQTAARLITTVLKETEQVGGVE